LNNYNPWIHDHNKFRVAVDIINIRARKRNTISYCFLEDVEKSGYFQPIRRGKKRFTRFDTVELAQQAILEFSQLEHYIYGQFSIQQYDKNIGVWKSVEAVEKTAPSLINMVGRLKNMATSNIG